MSGGDYGTIVQIGDVLVSEEVITEFFACDYERCRGCCCAIGDAGAPLREEETEALERHYPVYSPLMTPQGRAAAEGAGFFEIDREGDLVTPTVKTPHTVPGLTEVPGAPDGTLGTQGLEDCAYCLYEDGNVLCSIERCFISGKIPFRKPASCRLYPIRVTRMPGGGEALNYHRWRICSDAVRRGEREGIRVYQFLREPLTDLYGQDFYEALSAAAEHILHEKKQK